MVSDGIAVKYFREAPILLETTTCSIQRKECFSSICCVLLDSQKIAKSKRQPRQRPTKKMRKKQEVKISILCEEEPPTSHNI